MSTQNLMRWCGLSLILGGVGIALFLITLNPLGILGFGLGYILLGISTMRAGVLPRGAAILVIIGAALFMLPPQPLWPFPTLLTLLGAVLWGAGAAWIGFALWSSKGEMTG